MGQDCLDPRAFSYLADWLRLRSGLMLFEQPADFCAGRLLPVMRRFGFRTLTDLVDELPHDSAALSAAVIEAMTVGDTSFFRDESVFLALRDTVLPALISRRAAQKRLNIWSAACAGGQEVCSLAILLEDFGLSAGGWTIRLLGTDISSDAIDKARTAVYRNDEVIRGLSPRHRDRYFLPDDNGWQLHDTLQQMTAFHVRNLLEPFDSIAEGMDIILCRNVLMYLDRPLRCSVVSRLTEKLADDGVFLLGAGEMLPLQGSLRPLSLAAPGFYARIPLH